MYNQNATFSPLKETVCAAVKRLSFSQLYSFQVTRPTTLLWFHCTLHTLHTSETSLVKVRAAQLTSHTFPFSNWFSTFHSYDNSHKKTHIAHSNSLYTMASTPANSTVHIGSSNCCYSHFPISYTVD